MMKSLFITTFSLLGLTLLSIGCGGPKTTTVSGRVTVDGKPADSILVVFEPVASGLTVPETGIGLTDLEGRYTIRSARTDRNGLEPGDYTVYLSWYDPDAVEKPEDENAPPKPIVPLKPPKYVFPDGILRGELKYAVPDEKSVEADFDY